MLPIKPNEHTTTYMTRMLRENRVLEQGSDKTMMTSSSSNSDSSAMVWLFMLCSYNFENPTDDDDDDRSFHL